jgi:hypothetical protein
MKTIRPKRSTCGWPLIFEQRKIDLAVDNSQARFCSGVTLSLATLKMFQRVQSAGLSHVS